MMKPDYRKTIEFLNQNKLIVFSTDTINGIGTVFDNLEGLKEIFKLKNRDKNKPFALFFSKKIPVEKFFFTNRLFFILKQNFLPGQLTIILKAKRIIPDILVKEGFASLRIPNDKQILKLLDIYKKPLAVTSLNISNEEIITTKKDLEKYFGKFYIFKKLKKNKTPSTVIKIFKNDIQFIREGVIKKEKILKIIKRSSYAEKRKTS